MGIYSFSTNTQYAGTAPGKGSNRKASMQWKDEYSIGIEEIDNQHKTLLGHFSTVSEAISTRKSWAETHFEIIALKEFAHFHFRFEDMLMRLFDCPQREQHVELHDRFLREIADFEHSSLQKNSEQEVVQFFSDWLIHHIQGDDRDYARRIADGAKVVLSP